MQARLVMFRDGKLDLCVPIVELVDADRPFKPLLEIDVSDDAALKTMPAPVGKPR